MASSISKETKKAEGQQAGGGEDEFNSVGSILKGLLMNLNEK